LKAASRAYRGYLAEQPDDVDLRKRTALVYRYTANIHRLSDESAAALPLYRDAIRLYEDLNEQFPGELQYQESLSHTWRDQTTTLSQLGRLQEATHSVGRAIELAEAVRAAVHADRPGARRILASALLSRSSIEYTRGMLAESAATARQAAELFGA